MKSLFIYLFIIILIPVALTAEDWKFSSDMSLSLTQSAYSDSWQGTELSSITWLAASNSTAEKQLKPWLNNKSTLKLGFGQTHLQKINASGDKYWEQPDKSTDKIDLESVLRINTGGWVDPFIAGRWESQFIDKSDAAKLRVINPMLLTETAGIIRTLIQNDKTTFNARLGGAFREFIDRDALQTAGDRKTETTTDGGIEMVSEFKHGFSPVDANFKSRLQVYQALINSKSDDLNEDWKSPDMVWENVLTGKVWGIVSASLTFEARYEKEAVHELQWKQILGLGVSYSLF
ncbi:MAG: hypothetical protein CVU48_04830 [Candidatus Cloacimonetes bacterium HGW-Cloacimonetes-1]|jgi:hypothetical protein|nr:MAG: hypothetical protein CVU48_04830 [Candidatus Cloacimonetes bacterium HGW-Cloacimonetes-1]